MNDASCPVGEPVDSTPGELPRRGEFRGRFVRLRPVEPDADVEDLYSPTHGGEERERIWTYMGYGPFRDEGAMRDWLQGLRESSDPLFFTAIELRSERPVGIVSFLNIVPAARRLELGHIWYVPEAQRTPVNTDAVHLLLREAFERLGYRRVEWKCDALNARSRAAALRLGFTFEGIFRQHLIVKGRNRDTAWFSIIDREWPKVDERLSRWLESDGSSSLSAAAP